jgi:hypothetical protein
MRRWYAQESCCVKKVVYIEAARCGCNCYAADVADVLRAFEARVCRHLTGIGVARVIRVHGP